MTTSLRPGNSRWVTKAPHDEHRRAIFDEGVPDVRPATRSLSPVPPDLVAVILAAGLGTRLLPLTSLRPKCLCPIDNVALLDLAVASVRPHTAHIAVNTHYLAEQVETHLAGTDIHLSPEPDGLLSSGGALGHLRDWIDGRPVLVRNADAYLTDDLTELLDGWTGEHPRILVRDTHGPADFDTLRYVGACLIPGATVATLPDGVCGLYGRVWKPAWNDGTLELVEARGDVVDCGTHADYLAANMLASGGRSVIGARAVIEGSVVRCVIWPGAYVGPDEHLADVVRAGRHITVPADGHC